MPIGFSRSVFGLPAATTPASGLRNVTVDALGNVAGWPRLLRQDGSTVLAAPTLGSTSVAKFDGTGDAIGVTPESAGDFVFSGAYTFEFFFMYDADTGGASANLLSNKQDGGSTGGTDFFILFRNHDLKLQLHTPNQSVATASDALADDTWHHVALCRDASNNESLFVNGTRAQTTSSASSVIGTASTREKFGIGGFVNNAGSVALPFNQGGNGYMDMVRVSNTDRYGATNSSITVPTTAFTNDADTKFLIHCNVSEEANNFRDEKFEDRVSVGGFIGSYNASGTIDALSNTQSKFGTTSLQLTGSSTDSFAAIHYQNPGANDFTHELFFYPTTVSGNQAIFGAMNNSRTAQLFFLIGSNLKLYMNRDNNTSWGIASGVSFGTVNQNQWNHVALVRTTDTLELMLNGTRGNTVSLLSDVNLGNGAYESQTHQSSAPATGIEGYRQNFFSIGRVEGSTTPSTGFFGPCRISNNSRYTGSSYTVPTSNFTNDANTLALFTFDGTNGGRDIIDANT